MYSSSVKEITERPEMYLNGQIATEQLSLDLELQNGSFKVLSKQQAETNLKLRNMRGEDLHGLTVQELQDLERTLETGLRRIKKRKAEQIVEQINDLLKKGCELMEENTRLRYKVAEISRMEQQAVAETAFHGDRQSESVINLSQPLNLFGKTNVPNTLFK